MTARSPFRLTPSFGYGRAAGDELVEIASVDTVTITAEYENSEPQGWGFPAAFLTDSHGALWTRQLLVAPGGGSAGALIPWDISETTHVLAGSPELAPVNAAVLYGQTDAADPDPQFQQIGALSFDNADNLPQRGILTVAKAGQWRARTTAAENVLATATQAAPGGANLRHIVQGFAVSVSGLGNTPNDLTFRIRDGAGGTILHEEYIFKDAGLTSVRASQEDLALVLSANTAAVIEFSAAGGALTFEAVNIWGVTVTQN